MRQQQRCRLPGAALMPLYAWPTLYAVTGRMQEPGVPLPWWLGRRARAYLEAAARKPERDVM